MERLEKLVWIVAGIVVVLVVGFIFIGPLKSSITDDQVKDDFEKLNPDFKKGRRPVAMPGPVGPKRTFGAAQPGGAQPSSGSSVAVAHPPKPGGQEPPPPSGEQPPPFQPVAPSPYTDPALTAGQGEFAPVFIPQSMADKYKHFDDIRELGMTAAGEDFTTEQGEQAYILRGINEDSPLSTRLGFQPGDIIISVNGLAPSRGNARQLYDSLKSSKDFNVVVERAGQRSTMQYHIR